MADLRNPILATLSYYDAFDLPLTALETWRYLVNPARLEREALVGDIAVSAIVEELERLSKEGRIATKHGFFAVAGKADTIPARLEREKLSAQKWKKALAKAYWFQAVPYVRALAISGSLALDNSDAESDFDVLTITASGRIYTCRFFLLVIAAALRVRRRGHDRQAPDTFCFNHYVSEAGLAISHQSIYAAQTYARLIPMFVRDDALDRFSAANIWINKYVYHFKPDQSFARRGITPSGLLSVVARALEAFLHTFIGVLLERSLRYYQQRRIARNPVTRAPGGRIVASDTQLEFHPHSAELPVIERYNIALRGIGISPLLYEQDSGLQRDGLREL